MRCVEFVGPGRLEWRNAPEPKLEASTDALVRPFVVATCDLDHAIISGAVNVPGPFAFGHEGIAEVVAVGAAVSKFRVGDVVSVPFQVSCGSCASCRAGRTAHCIGVERLSMYGLGPLSGRDWGGFLSDLVRVPFADHMLIAVPEDVDPRAVASLSDNIVDGWRLVAPQLAADPGAKVLIVGGDSVSLYATAVALALGAASVDYVGGGTHQQEVARRLGAAVIEGPVPERLGPYPITVNATSERKCLHCAIRSTGPDGACTSAGIFFGDDPTMPLMEMYTKGIRFQTGRVHARDVMPAALKLVEERKILPELITAETADWNDSVEALVSHKAKLVITRPREFA